MASTSITKVGSKGHHRFTLAINETGTSVANNTSTITYTFSLSAEQTGWNFSQYNIPWGITIENTDVTGVINSYDGSSTVTLASGTLSIPHNSDGTKTMVFSFSVSDTSGVNYTTGDAVQTGSLTLTTIARESDFTITGDTIGGVIEVNIDKKITTAKHKVYYGFGSATTTLSTNADTSTSGTIPMALANQIPNSTYGTGTMYVETYVGSTTIGKKSKTFTLYVPSSVVPTISNFTLTDNTNNYTKYGAYVQGKSNVVGKITASGSYGSTISSYSTKITNLTTQTSSEFTISNINVSGTINFGATVKDSRGRSSTTSSKSITVLAYSSPKASLTVARSDNNQATAVATISASISSLNSKNSKSFQLQYKKISDYSWTTIDLNSTNYSLSTVQNVTISEDNSYNFRLVVKDDFTTTYATVDIGTAETLINFNTSGNGFAVGKVSEKENDIEIEKKVYYYGDDLEYMLPTEKYVDWVNDRETKTFDVENGGAYFYLNAHTYARSLIFITVYNDRVTTDKIFSYGSASVPTVTLNNYKITITAPAQSRGHLFRLRHVWCA